MIAATEGLLDQVPFPLKERGILRLRFKIVVLADARARRPKATNTGLEVLKQVSCFLRRAKKILAFYGLRYTFRGEKKGDKRAARAVA